MWNTVQQALLYISVQEKLPGLPTQRSKCEVWPDQTFFHFWVYKQMESVRQIVWLGWSSARDMSESVDTLLSDVAAPSSCALIASSKVSLLVWYTWKHGHAQRNLLHGPQRNLVLRPFGFLWHSVQMWCFLPPTFLGIIFWGKWWSLKHCSGCNARTCRAELLKAWSWLPSSTRAKTTVEQKSAWFCRFKFPVRRETLGLLFACGTAFAIVSCWLRLHSSWNDLSQWNRPPARPPIVFSPVGGGSGDSNNTRVRVGVTLLCHGNDKASVNVGEPTPEYNWYFFFIDVPF